MGAAAVPIALAVAGAGVQMYAQNKAAKQADRIALDNLSKQRRTQQQADAKVAETLADLQRSSSADEKASRFDAGAQQLRMNQQRALAGISNTGGGEAATTAADTAKEKVADYGTSMNDLFSTIDAAGLQRLGESFDRADLHDSIGLLKRNSMADRDIMNLKLQGVRPNPWLQLLSTGLGAAAGSYMPKTMAGGVGPWNTPTSITNPTPTWFTNPTMAGGSNFSIPFKV